MASESLLTTSLLQIVNRLAASWLSKFVFDNLQQMRGDFGYLDF